MLKWTTGNLSYTNTSIYTGTTYFYKVRCYRLVGTARVYSLFSNVVSAQAILLSPVSTDAVAVSATSIKVSWTPVAGVTRYEVWSSTTVDGIHALKTTTTARSYTNTGLTTGNTYFYKVRAYRLAGTTRVYGAFGSIASATTL